MMYGQSPQVFYAISILTYYLVFFVLFYLFALFSNSKLTLVKLLFIAIFGLIITIPLSGTYYFFNKNAYITNSDREFEIEESNKKYAIKNIKNELGPKAKIKFLENGMILGTIKNSDKIEKFTTDNEYARQNCGDVKYQEDGSPCIIALAMKLKELYPNGLNNITVFITSTKNNYCELILEGLPNKSCKKLIDYIIDTGEILDFDNSFENDIISDNTIIDDDPTTSDIIIDDDPIIDDDGIIEQHKKIFRQEVNLLISKFDLNNDGLLTLDEFKYFYYYVAGYKSKKIEIPILKLHEINLIQSLDSDRFIEPMYSWIDNYNKNKKSGDPTANFINLENGKYTINIYNYMETFIIYLSNEIITSANPDILDKELEKMRKTSLYINANYNKNLFIKNDALETLMPIYREILLEMLLLSFSDLMLQYD